MMLPAGLPPDYIEFFKDPENAEICYALTAFGAFRVKDLPETIKVMIWADINAHPEKLAMLFTLGYDGITMNDQVLEKYCSCVFGAFDGTPDYANGKFIHTEYVPCAKRNTCPGNGILCNPLQVGDGATLTARQADILALIGKCLLNKEIAHLLRISPNTVKIHVHDIQIKAGLMNKKDLVLLAHQKHLA